MLGRETGSSGYSIPFVDLIAQHRSLKEQLVHAFVEAVEGAAFVGGSAVEKFEHDFAAFVGTDYCVGVSSGTDALRLALIAVGVRPGDRVITVPNTFVATTEAISQAGGIIEFVDVDPHTCLMDLNLLSALLDKRFSSAPEEQRPVAVVPVHLYGQPAEMTEILELARQYGLAVIEDAAQAHGASHRGRAAGSMADAAAFSFYPAKNLGACGEAGAVTTNEMAIAEKIQTLRDHGQQTKYHHVTEGYNGRLDAIQASFLSVKLPLLKRWNALRLDRAKRYDDAFQRFDWIRPVKVLPHNVSAYHLYVVQLQHREQLRIYLSKEHIGTGMHYPIPLHLQPCYAHLGISQGAFPVVEYWADHLLSLPLYPELTVDQLDRVIMAIQAYGEKS